MILKRNLLHFKQARKLHVGKVKKFQQKSCKNKQVMRNMSCVRCQMTPLAVLVLTTDKLVNFLDFCTDANFYYTLMVASTMMVAPALTRLV